VGSNPYSSLEPDPGSRSAPALKVSASTALLRGFRKRCPRCGERETFVSWFQPPQACPRCELRFAKEEGGFLGAMTLNYLVAIGLWVVVLVVVVVMTVPDVPVVPMMLLSAVVLIGVPLLFYPRSKLIWAAVEFLVLQGEPEYRPPVARDARQRELE
jgi:uncharacterized protein (DUF983 family)